MTTTQTDRVRAVKYDIALQLENRSVTRKGHGPPRLLRSKIGHDLAGGGDYRLRRLSRDLMPALSNDDLPPARGEPSQFGLNLVHPYLPVGHELPVVVCRMRRRVHPAGGEHDQRAIAKSARGRGLVVALR